MAMPIRQSPPEREPEPEVPHLRFLRLLTGGLAVVMALGIVAIVAILWLRLGPVTPQPLIELPDSLQLPDGSRAAAVTVTANRLIVVTETDTVLVFDRDGRLIQTVTLD